MTPHTHTHTRLYGIEPLVLWELYVYTLLDVDDAINMTLDMQLLCHVCSHVAVSVLNKPCSWRYYINYAL